MCIDLYILKLLKSVVVFIVAITTDASSALS